MQLYFLGKINEFHHLQTDMNLCNITQSVSGDVSMYLYFWRHATSTLYEIIRQSLQIIDSSKISSLEKLWCRKNVRRVIK